MSGFTLYQFPGDRGLSISPYCNKVHWALRLAGQAYRTESMLFPRKVSATGKLPVLVHDGDKIHDSSEILRYVDAKLPRANLVPRDRRRGAEAHVIEEWADEAFVPLVIHLGWESPRALDVYGPMLFPTLPVAMRRVPIAVTKRAARNRAAYYVERRPAWVREQLERHLDAVDALSSGREWLVSDVPCIADLAVACALYTLTWGGTPDEEALLRSRENANAWFERFVARASHVAR